MLSEHTLVLNVLWIDQVKLQARISCGKMNHSLRHVIFIDTLREGGREGGSEFSGP